MNKSKITIPVYFLFFFIYFNQGSWAITSDSIYYLMRETWNWSVTKIALVGMITTIPWIVKPLWGLIVDWFPIKQTKTKYWLIINYFIAILTCIYVVLTGLNQVTIVIVGLIIAYVFAFNDVAGDGLVCVLEKKYKLQGKLQAIAWFGLSLASLITGLLGAWVSKHQHYKLAYFLAIIFPSIMIYFLVTKHREPKVSKKKIDKQELRDTFKVFLDKRLLFAMAFLFCFFLSPSFGTPLRVYMREVMGIDKMFIGVLGGIGTAFGMLGYLLYFFKIHKYNIKKLLYFSVLFSAFSSLWYLYLPNKWVLLGYSIILGTIGAISHLCILAYVAKITPKNHEGLVFAGICSVLNLGSMGSSYLGGILYDYVGYKPLVIITAIYTLVCLFFIPKLIISKDN